MEKSCVLGISCQKFVRQVVDEVRRVADTYVEMKRNKNGCIRITMVPLSGLADEWLGGSEEDFNPQDVCEREFVFKINPEGKHTIQYVCEDGHTEPVNCYGYSALKVAYASWQRQMTAWAKEYGWPDTLVESEYVRLGQFMIAENGYSTDKGVVWMTIRLNDEDFLRMYVTVSGFQTGEDDEACALMGKNMAQKVLKEVCNCIEVSDE